MEKEKHTNTKEDIEFLKKFKIFVLTVGLVVGLTLAARCSYDKRMKNNEYLDKNGTKVKNPISEITIDDCSGELLVLKKIR